MQRQPAEAQTAGVDPPSMFISLSFCLYSYSFLLVAQHFFLVFCLLGRRKQPASHWLLCGALLSHLCPRLVEFVMTGGVTDVTLTPQHTVNTTDGCLGGKTLLIITVLQI